jgi:hypothetical protein
MSRRMALLSIFQKRNQSLEFLLAIAILLLLFRQPLVTLEREECLAAVERQNFIQIGCKKGHYIEYHLGCNYEAK